MGSIGIDIEEISRFKHLLARKPYLLQKMFSDYEWAYASRKNSAQTLAGIWCAKEAVVKALYSQNIKTTVSNVHILHNEAGVPRIDNLFDVPILELNKIKISISHTKNYAVGICLIEI
jgi:holo-[acyl-carrier protein] synthase